MKPRILLLSTAYLPLIGGSELAIRNLTDRMQGYDFDMVTGRYSSDVAASEQVGRIRLFRVGGRWQRLSFVFTKALLPLAIFFMALRLTRRQQYVMVHAYQGSHAAGAAWLLSWFRPELSFLLTIQEGKELGRQSWFVRKARELIFKRVTAVTAISAYLADYARSITTAPIHIVPNGVSLDRFRSRPAPDVLARAREHMRIAPHNRVIISVSRLVPKNGLANLIRAFRIIREKMIEDTPVLVLIGEGPEEGELKHLALLEGISSDVRFLGNVEHSHLPAYLHSSQVFSRPSLSEGMGSAFLEAMATGTPVVASTVGGIADFLEDGITGFACDPNDPESIAGALMRAMASSEEVKNVRDNAREVVNKRYDWATIAEKMSSVYQELTHE